MQIWKFVWLSELECVWFFASHVKLKRRIMQTSLLLKICSVSYERALRGLNIYQRLTCVKTLGLQARVILL